MESSSAFGATRSVRSRIEQIDDAETCARGLVGVGRANAPAGGPDGRGSRLGDLLDDAVVRKDHVGRARDEEPAVDRDPLLEHGLPLAPERLWIDHDTVSDVADSPGTKDPGRNQMQDELAVAHTDGVPRVRAPLVPGDDVRVLAQKVDDLPLPLVTPLGADHDTARHGDASK